MPVTPFLYHLPTHGELQPHLAQEYLLTNGMGAFSFSTVLGCNTRRYHGILCAATHPPLGRMITLSRLGEILCLDGRTDRLLELSVNVFEGGAIHPRGDRYLRQFDLGQVARWTYDVEGIEVVKELQLVWGQNVAGVRYTIRPDAPRVVRFELLPFVAMRDFHSLRRGTDFPFRTVSSGPHVKVEDGHHQLHLRANWGAFREQADWWRNHKYPVETERGQDDTEDLFNPGRFVFEGTGEMSITLWAGLADPASRDWDAELQRHPDATRPANRLVAPRGPRGEQIRREKGEQQDLPKAIASPAVTGEASSTIQRLFRAAADFVVLRNRPDGKAGTTVLAGFPWFADWGRDTMISVPGLLLVTGRFTEACQVLSVFAQYVSEGMIPNKFDDYTNEPAYNTVDASLWFVHACFEYLAYSGDQKTFDQTLLPACREVLRGYKGGTRYHIGMDEADGLITQGDATTQLTWMDAKIGDVSFTPRQGKPVEINALWYNALRLLGEHELADKVEKTFRKAFYLSPFRGLADVVTGSPNSYARDTSLRPNQIFAVSLPHSPLTRDQQSAVVEVCRRELLTPHGLRTLAKSDPRYIGRYTGDRWQRDGAYHNGTVWPWLIGGFLEAYLKVNDFSPQAEHQAREWLAPLINQMHDRGCIGQIAEVYDGDEPQRPLGCCAQAWSVAEVLRLAAMLGM
ncbi:MAG TPA: amylo-alpha-1,6-glucosidase [Tepidisphaeraceae bacterium]|jgi:glycogen debranching enzyme